MSLDTTSIDKEIARLGVEALMFWELPKVENALNDVNPGFIQIIEKSEESLT